VRDKDYVTGIVTTVHTRNGHSFAFTQAVHRPNADPNISVSIQSEAAINSALDEINADIIDLARDRDLL
jgi:hypothetical protein